MSWQSATKPLPGETSPRRVFEKLIGVADQSLRPFAKRSVLDVVEDRRRLAAALGAEDRRRLEAYFETIRRVEQQVDVVERDLQRQPTVGTVVPVASTDDETSFAAQARVLFDLLLLAYQTDATRVATFQLGCPGPHAAGDRLARGNQVAATLFTEFVGNLAGTPAGDGTLLDQTLLMFGSSASEPTDRPSADMPLILAGGPLRDGPRHVTASGKTVADVHRWVLSYAERTPRVAQRTLGTRQTCVDLTPKALHTSP